MKSNYEIQKIKGLQLYTLEEWGGLGVLERDDIPACRLVFTRNESEKYDHVSIAPVDDITPTWDEMCTLKDLFFRDDEECVQIHPKAEHYVNIKKNCLHLWHRVDGTLYREESMDSLTFIIDGQPATKKNHGIIARGHAAVLPSKNYKKYAESFRQQMLYKISASRYQHFETGVQVTAHYYLQNRAHYPDLVGLMQATADIISDEYVTVNHKKVLVQRWLLSDDRIIKSWDGTKIAGIDKDRPRVEITIKKLETDLATETDPQIIRILEGEEMDSLKPCHG